MYPLLTNINSQFIDSCGKPLSGGKVYTYEANTTTPKLTYADTNGQSPNTNPIILDESGRANIYMADGAYRIRVLDKKDALVADTPKISRYVTNTELEAFIQNIEAGLSELEQVKESLEIFAVAAVDDKKGMPDGLAPLGANTKVDPIYLPALPNDAIPQATESIIGVVKISNTLTSAAVDAALTAAQGKVLNDQAFGIGQNWQDVTVSRAFNTTYTNSTPKPRFVLVTAAAGQNSGIAAIVGSIQLPTTMLSYFSTTPVFALFFVSPGATYSVTPVSSATLTKWMEF